MSLPRRFPHLILAAALLLLASCGFRLRGEATLPFESIYVQGAATSPFTIQLKRSIVSATKARLTDRPQEAQVVLQIMSERRDKEILALSGGGRVREYYLRYHVTYRLTDPKLVSEYIAPTEIVLRRELTYSDAEALAKESEEMLLFRDMQTDAARQLLFRLQVVKLEVKS
ncbi:MAG: LPS-assembly lipoprotein LptE [Betaproteobacteria bacterium]